MTLRRLIILTVVTALSVTKGVAFPLKVTGLDTLNTAVWIHDLRWGYDLVNANIDKALIPASVMKSVTCASLLNLAESNERFATHVVFSGQMRDSVLDGNVIVRAIGDPTIESVFLSESQGFTDSIAAALSRAGIRRITGNVIIDDSGFPDATTPHGWMAEDIVWPYGARLHGANFHDNRFQLSLPSKKTVPEVPDLKFQYVKSNRRGLKVDRKDGSETFIITGSPRRGFSDTYSMPYPAKSMRAAILAALDEADITVAGNKLASRDGETELYTHLSPRFGDIMQSLMHRSDNLMAEGMLRAIAPGGTRAHAIEEEMAVWTMAGIGAHGVRIIDGSGLSRDNRLTARFLGQIYQYMLGEDFGDEYVSLFPLAGRHGTMRNFLVDTPLEGRVAMKTGSMKGVQSYSGYLLDEEGRPTHLLVFMANGFKCSRQALKNDIQRLLLELFDVSLQDN
ncbi:MAG: D-alanyl-D-alanine carboxypeptidase/D-alanyl-D-alanine-endopeptidase [Bacteroides sp.]|nr:D-alanyl-D-alanine carboxypeptidase/D-alanyl-D-alanine-endopeptidase [Bacteroides sp.]